MGMLGPARAILARGRLPPMGHQPEGSLRDLIAMPPIMAGVGGAVGGTAGAAFGAAGNPDDPLGGAMRGATMAGGSMAAGMGGVGLAASGVMGVKQLVMMFARKLKAMHPDADDAQILDAAKALAQRTSGEDI